MQLSVIMTTYNRPGVLQRVLEGLAQQTRLPDEVIIADDGSGTETADVIECFKKTSPFILEHVWHADQGFRAATIRNKAIRKSTGAYLVSLDGDCIPDRWFIADHLKLARQGAFFQGKRILVGKALSQTFTFRDIDTFYKKMKLLFAPGIGNRHHLARIPFFPVATSKNLSGIRSCNMGFHRDDIFAVNGFNEDFNGWGREDSELAVRLYNYGLKRVTHAFAAVCYHLWHAENDRSGLARNDALLKWGIEKGATVCANGLEKRTSDDV
jgi:glycosyltransferase involved in cell wall biosynthesis